MERKFTFKKPGKSSSETASISSLTSCSLTSTKSITNVQKSFIGKKNNENIPQSVTTTANLLKQYSPEENKISNANTKISGSELLKNLEDEENKKLRKITNQTIDKSQTIHPFFGQKNKTTQNSQPKKLAFENDDEKDFIKEPKKKPLKQENDEIFQKSINKFENENLPIFHHTKIKKENDSISKIQRPKEEVLLDHKEFCPSCKCKYMSTGAKRRLIDACDHGACFSCVMKQIKCVVCNQIESEIKEEKKTEDQILKNAGLSLELMESIIESPEKNIKAEIVPDSPIVLSAKKKSLKNDSDEELADLKPLKVSSSIKEFEKIDRISNQYKQAEKKVVNEIEILELEDDFKSLNNTSTQIATKNNGLKEYDVETYDDEDDEDLCVIEDFDFDSIDTKNRNDQMLNNQQTKGVYIPDIERYEKINWLFNDIKDCSYQFRSTEYEHTDEMLTIFRNSFGLKHFRPQQFEAVNAALLGINVFILMPTGGGKSLCYQLPAVISKGVTFVISPLKSLIIDQVQKLNALGLSACHMLSDADSSAECDYVYKELVKQEPKYKLVYITPEKLNNSSKLRNVVMNLYNRGMIARLVIDEAHCVSQWGHDFRTDYKKIGELRFTLMPNVPCMLLTATATPRVRNDILMQMKLSVSETASVNKTAFKSAFVTSVQNNQMNKLETKLNNRHYMSVSMNSLPANNQQCVFFMQSFNRENLQYQVEYKTSNAAALEKISDLIKSKYANKSGIVYCISRNECEQVSEYLRKKQIKALPYHAGMDDQKRQQIQHKWTNNIDCKVVCATIAFGMGIDKPDVRYVVHLGLPKSLEGYYQESGRAGRDGAVSLCLLFYNNQDRHKWLRLMQNEQKGASYNPVAYKTHVDNIYRMAQYCDNRTDCRRAQILEYFGEKFDRTKCIESKMKTICDNCQLFAENKCSLVDITTDAAIICRGIQQLSFKDDITLLHLSEILKGSMNCKITEKGHHNLEMHAKLSKYKKNDIERIVRKLVFLGYLKEDVKILQHSETVASYIKVGPKANQLISNSAKIEFELIDDGTKVSKKCKVVDDSDDEQNTTKTSKNNKLSDSSAINRILLRCQSDIKRLIKTIGSDKGVKNMSSLFTPKMLSEMLSRLPETKEDLLCITGYTQSVFSNYKGEEFLTIFKHYARIKREIQQEEIKKMEQKQKEKAKARAIQSQACYKNNKTYGLIDENQVTDIDFDSSKWLTSKPSNSGYEGKNYKRKNFSKSYPNNKKAKTSYDTTDENSSNYFNSNQKKKFYFKNKAKFKKKY